MSFERCAECPLKGAPFVPPEPAKTSPQLILIGESPGRIEILAEKPFKGPSGRLLNQALSRLHVRREACHITNATLCVPSDSAQLREAAKVCSKRLQTELADIPRQVTAVPMGTPAIRALTGRSVGILRARGFVWRALDGRPVLPTVHPAYVLRTPGFDPIFMSDLQRAATWTPRKRLEKPRYSIAYLPSVALRELARLRTDVILGLDVEADTAEPMTAKLRTVQVSDGILTVVVVWVRGMLRILREFLRGKRVSMHNGYSFDLIVLERHGITIPFGSWEDTLVGHHVYAGHAKQSMSHVVSMHLNCPPWKVDYGLKSANGKDQARKLSADTFYLYGAYDAHIQARLTPHVLREARYEGSLYEEDKVVADLCRVMQMRGMHVNREKRLELISALQGKKNGYIFLMREMAGDKNFDPNNYAHIRKVLYERMGAPILGRTGIMGLPSTSAAILEKLSVEDRTDWGQFSKIITKYRSSAKTESTFLVKLIIDAMGRVHPGWKLGPVTGRWACSHPNLMNLPVPGSDPEGQIRFIYDAEDGYCLVYFDLKAIEARTMAYLSGDEAYIAAVEEEDRGGDSLHTQNARKIFSDDPVAMAVLYNDKIAKKPEGGKKFRDVTKNCFFAVCYGANWEKVYVTLIKDGFHVKPEMAQLFIDKIHAAYPTYFAWSERNIEFVRKHGYMRCQISGRLRHFSLSPNPNEIRNSPIQTAVGSLMNKKLPLIEKRIRSIRGIRNGGTVAQVHDSATFEVPEELNDQVRAIVRDVWAEPVKVGGREFVFPIDLKPKDDGEILRVWGEA